MLDRAGCGERLRSEGRDDHILAKHPGAGSRQGSQRIISAEHSAANECCTPTKEKRCAGQGREERRLGKGIAGQALGRTMLEEIEGKMVKEQINTK